MKSNRRRQRAPRGSTNAAIPLRLPAEMLRMVKAAAKRDGTSAAEWVRQVVWKKLQTGKCQITLQTAELKAWGAGPLRISWEQHPDVRPMKIESVKFRQIPG